MAMVQEKITGNSTKLYRRQPYPVIVPAERSRVEIGFPFGKTKNLWTVTVLRVVFVGGTKFMLS